MELRSVSTEVEVKYPTKSEMNKKKICSSIPNTWKVLGITSLMFSNMIEKKVCAVSNSISGDIQESLMIAGGLAYNIPNPDFILLRNLNTIIVLISMVTFFVGMFDFCKVKRTLKKSEEENINIKKKYKIFFALSIVTFVVFLVIFLLLISGVVPPNLTGYY